MTSFEATVKINSIELLRKAVESGNATLGDLIAEGVDDDIVEAVNAIMKYSHETYLEYILRLNAVPLARLAKLTELHKMLRNAKKGDLKDKYELALHVLNGRPDHSTKHDENEE